MTCCSEKEEALFVGREGRGTDSGNLPPLRDYVIRAPYNPLCELLTAPCFSVFGLVETGHEKDRKAILCDK